MTSKQRNLVAVAATVLSLAGGSGVAWARTGEPGYPGAPGRPGRPGRPEHRDNRQHRDDWHDRLDHKQDVVVEHGHHERGHDRARHLAVVLDHRHHGRRRSCATWVAGATNSSRCSARWLRCSQSQIP